MFIKTVFCLTLLQLTAANVLSRQLLSGVIRASVKGFYHSKTEPITNECLGDQIEDQVNLIYKSRSIFELFGQLEEIDEIRINIIDGCKIKQVSWDLEKWCLTNQYKCLGADSKFVNRLVDHGVRHLYNLYETWEVIRQTIRAGQADLTMLEQTLENLASSYSYIIGFDMSWNQQV